MIRNAWVPALVVVAVLGAASVFALNNPQRVEDMKADLETAAAKATSSTLEVPAGTPIALTLGTTLSTKSASVGDRFSATVASPVHVHGDVAIPAGAEVSGRVVIAKQPGKSSGRGALQLEFENLSFEGRTYALDSRSRVYQSKSGTSKDVKLIGGGAAAGAVVGGILGGSAGDAAKGAVVGGATGTAASLLTRGPQLTLERGTALSFTLDRDVAVRPPSES
jgi:hypothetical protein